MERFCLIPIYVRRVRGLGDALYVAMDDPTNAQALAEVAERSGLHVRAMIAPPSDIRAAIRAYYGIGPEPASPSPLQPKLADVEESVATGIVSRADVESQAAQAAIALGQAGMDLAPAEPGRAAAGEAPLAAIAPAKKPARLPTGSAAAAAASPASEASTAIASDPASAAAPSTKKGEPGARRAPGERARMAKASPGRKMIALTLLDGTTIRLPSKGKGGGDGAEGGESDDSPEGARGSGDLTARDLVAALRAAAHGADATEILGENVRWEAMFASLLSVLLKKHLISDWEFVEELTKSDAISGSVNPASRRTTLVCSPGLGAGAGTRSRGVTGVRYSWSDALPALVSTKTPRAASWRSPRSSSGCSTGSTQQSCSSPKRSHSARVLDANTSANRAFMAS